MNPFNESQVVAAVHTAVAAGPDDRRRRMLSMRRSLGGYDHRTWLESVIRSVAAVGATRPNGMPVPDGVGAGHRPTPTDTTEPMATP